MAISPTCLRERGKSSDAIEIGISRNQCHVYSERFCKKNISKVLFPVREVQWLPFSSPLKPISGAVTEYLRSAVSDSDQNLIRAPHFPSTTPYSSSLSAQLASKLGDQYAGFGSPRDHVQSVTLGSAPALHANYTHISSIGFLQLAETSPWKSVYRASNLLPESEAGDGGAQHQPPFAPVLLHSRTGQAITC